ncbi:hypothetical protein [Paraburkholderia jirisanensis]
MTMLFYRGDLMGIHARWVPRIDSGEPAELASSGEPRGGGRSAAGWRWVLCRGCVSALQSFSVSERGC